MTSCARSPRTDEEIVDDGPWRATRLWNSIVRNVQQGLPLKRHRRQLRTYENCFTAVEAVEWLHKHLKKNPNFDAEVTKEQTIMLLGKLLLAGVIHPIDTSISSFSSDLNLRDSQKSLSQPEFKPNHDLYRLGDDLMPKKVLNTPQKRPPLRDVKSESNKKALPRGLLRSSFRRTLNKFRHQQDDEYDEEDVENVVDSGRKYSAKDRQNMNLSYLQSLPSNSLVVLDNDTTWRSVYVQLLEKSLSAAHVKSLDIDVSNIIFNMTNVSAKGVVQIKTCKDREDLPSWTLSAMKCLANWSPDKRRQIDANIPSYPGFENDVFEVVKDYFETLLHKNGPLTTYKLFDIFVSAFIKAEAVGVSMMGAPPKQKFEQNPAEISHIVDRRKSMNRQFTETNLDDQPAAQTSTPNSSQQKVSRDNHYYTLQRGYVKAPRPSDVYMMATNRERIAKIRQTYEVEVPPPPQSFQGCSRPSWQGNYLNSNMSTTAIMRNFLPPNT